MGISFSTINGASLGIEYVGNETETEDDYVNTVIVDVFVIRMLIQW